MKEKLKAALKKISVILIASLMILGVVPIGMITLRPHTARAEGEFVRLSPTAEASVMDTVMAQNFEEEPLKEGVLLAGNPCDTYLQFNLQSLLNNKNLGEIQQVTLRLVALPEDADTAMPIRLSLMPSSDWDGNMKWENKPALLEEQTLTEFTVDTQAMDAKVVEIDLTRHLQEWLDAETERISFHLYTTGSGIGAAFAGAAYEDAAYRPSLKIVTGKATDPDSDDLTKAWLSRTIQRGNKTGRDLLYAGDGKDAFVQFSLHPDNIQGVMYTAQLNLPILYMEDTAELVVYKLNHAQWEESQPIPQGEETLIYAAAKEKIAAASSIDVTDVLNDAYAKGETRLTLRIGSRNGEVTLDNSSDAAPYLNIQASDRAHVIAATEAAIYALDENASANAITGNLSDSYTTETGSRADIRWTASDIQTGEDASFLLDANGRISRPQWFEDSKQIQATADISCGDFSRRRTYTLTVLPEDAPDYTDTEFDDYIDLGDSDEDTNGFAQRNTAGHNRWIGAKTFSYRTLKEEGMMAFSLAVDPEEQNYLTIKVWNADRPTMPLVIENLQNREAAPMQLEAPAELAAEDGFLYLTCPIPKEQTVGKSYVSLRITELLSEIAEEEKFHWNLYGAYMTQTPYFDPLVFAEKGEAFAGKKTDNDSAFLRLLRRMYAAATRFLDEDVPQDVPEDVPIPDAEAETQAATQEPFVWVESDPPMLAFDNESDRIAISVHREEQEVEIHRNSPQYDVYCRTDLHIYQGLSVIDYGKYRIFRNTASVSQPIPWEEESLTGIYRDMLSGVYYAFLKDGQMADDSVLPAGADLRSGKTLQLPADSTVILEHLAEPLYSAEWRISAINHRAVSQINLSRTLTVSSVTVKNTGYDPEKEEDLQVICCAYENGMLSGMTRKVFTVIPGYAEYQVELPPFTVAPTQTLKIFVEPSILPLQELTPKLSLPQSK